MVRFRSQESLFNCSKAAPTFVHYPMQEWEDEKKEKEHKNSQETKVTSTWGHLKHFRISSMALEAASKHSLKAIIKYKASHLCGHVHSYSHI